MQKILLLLVVSFFVGKNCEAQNLVPNPSFELLDSCPPGISSIYVCQGWHTYSPSPDYFNACYSSGGQYPIGVPINFVGYQQAATGQAYCGFICYSPFPWNSMSHEIIGRQLASPLQIGTKYFASIKVNLADSSGIALNKLGIAFSTFPIIENDTMGIPVFNYSTISSNSIITDTANWIIISGSFIADSVYQSILIGNFYDNTITDTIHLTLPLGSTNESNCYYYIDDVCVSPDSLECDLNPEGIYNLKETKASINLYPNPASSELAVSSGQLASRIEVVDALGRILFTVAKPLPTSNIQLQTFSSGIYFIKLYFTDGSMEVRRFVRAASCGKE